MENHHLSPPNPEVGGDVSRADFMFFLVFFLVKKRTKVPSNNHGDF
jgi:hypothetical protein